MKIGITGINGFVGTHLSNYLSLQEGVILIPFYRSYFDSNDDLEIFVQECDVIVHLAGLNRHNVDQEIFNTNTRLAQLIVDACLITNSKPHILFSSSSQEEKQNIYGNSKRIARETLESWAIENGSLATGMIIPNVFGPFGHPYYNSVVATFCHQLTHGETPVIQQDGLIKLIYVNKLTEEIYNLIQNPKQGKIEIEHQFEKKVSDLLSTLINYKSLYFEQGIFPELGTPWQLALFNTFRCYIDHNHYPVPFMLNKDDRGTFVEIAKTNTSGQFSFSTTNPGITRGNHFHTRKAERFAVIKGKAKISLRKMGTNDVIDYFLDGTEPSYVDMPIWTTHNITNIGEEELVTLFWINEPYNPEDPDTYFVDL
jgi:UDP-2-acetamido-2,6-beta-L-arabino-hexul-4-ose reductase